MDKQAGEFLKTGLDLAVGGEIDRAEYFLLKSYEIEQGQRTCSTLGWFYGLLLNRPLEGFKYFRRAIKYNPSSGDAYNECGNLLFRAGYSKESLKWFHRSLRSKDNTRAHYVLYNLAVVYNRLNRPERSLRYLNLALRKSPDFASAEKLLREVRRTLEQKKPSRTA